MPGVCGLPAGSVKGNETYEQAIIRSGRQKLGVDLEPTRFIGRGSIERADFILHMEEYEARITAGEPEVPQPVKEVTQYEQWKWGTKNDLQDAADKGSLCSQLYLASND